MKTIMSLLLVGFAGLIGTNAWAGSAMKTRSTACKSRWMFYAIMATPDKAFRRSAKPCEVHLGRSDLIKGGFIAGGKHGRGVASCRTADGWVTPAFVSVGGGSWGLQIGVEGVDLVMLVMNDQGFQHLLSSKFEFTGEGSIAAGQSAVMPPPERTGR